MLISEKVDIKARSISRNKERRGTFYTDQRFKKIPSKRYNYLKSRDFPGGAVVKNPPANTGDTGSSPGLGRSHMPRSN